MKKKNGFTLIELIIVIAIIMILMAISTVGINIVRKRGRDARRKADLNTVRAALSMFYADKKVYPLPVLPDAGTGFTEGYFNGQKSGYSGMVGWEGQAGTESGLKADGYLESVIMDPLREDDKTGCTTADCFYRYRVGDSGLTFELSAQLEVLTDTDLKTDNTDPATKDDTRFEVGNDKSLDTSSNSYWWGWAFDSDYNPVTPTATHNCTNCKTE